MQENDFVSSVDLQSLIVNRKKDLNGAKINWYNFRTILYSKEELFVLTVTCDNDKEQKIRLTKKNSNEKSLADCSLNCLFTGGRAISDKKYADLMHLLMYIPKEKHEFFVNLKCDRSNDFGLASDISGEKHLLGAKKWNTQSFTPLFI